MKRHLFYTFLWIFGITSIVTLLGVTGVIKIADGYLWALVSAFLVESAGAVVAIFKRAEFFSDEPGSGDLMAQAERRHAAEIAQLKSEHAAEIYRLKNPPAPTIEDIYKRLGK